jgi:amino acid adenylation domain-containing protein
MNLPVPQTLPELFDECARATPRAIAVVCNREFLTYQELDDRARILAARLRDAGVASDMPVGLCVDRSIDMIVRMLAILKSGGAYVPLPPTHPRDRLAFMVADCGAHVVVGPQRYRAAVPLDGQTWVSIEEGGRGEPAPCERPEGCGSGAVAGDLAYIMYTSGSTGRPKGVEVAHESVVNLLTTLPVKLCTGPGDVWTVFHSYAFDFSVWEIWAPLTTGATLVIVPEETCRSPSQLADLLRKHRVTVLNLTPSALVQLVGAVPAEALNELAVTTVICGGDAFPAAHIAQLLQWNVALWNFYGPTETTVWSCTARVSKEDAPDGVVSLGEPVPNMQVHLLDDGLQPVPQGTPGEICVSGKGIARGYRNLPDLTAQRFVTVNGERLYRTGDLAIQEPGGRLRFIGRGDHQIKLRGYRIELGEIEAQLGRHPSVSEVVICLAGMNQHSPRLVAFVTQRPDAAPCSAAVLQTHLRTSLPAYMIPAEFIALDRLPLNASGKVDRSALSALASARPLSQPRSAPAMTVTEKALTDMWEQMLTVRPIGIHDHFFDIGGDSLSAMSMMTQIERRFGVTVTPDLFLRHPTIAQLAGALDILSANSKSGSALPRAAKQLGAIASAIAGQVRRFGDRLDAGRRRVANEVQEIRDLLQCLNAKSALVTLQNGSVGRPPLFCVPGVVGSVIYLYDLARSMGADQTFIGLQAPGLDGKSDPIASVDGLARHYIDAIRSVQPTGPYYLAGHSNGAHVALEIALQLESAGEVIGLLTVLDEVAPVVPTYYERDYWDDARLHTYLARLIQDWTGNRLEIDYDRMAALDADGQWHLLMKWMREVNVALPFIGKAQIRGMMRTLKAGLTAHYTPKSKLMGPLMLLRTSEPHLDETTTPEYLEFRKAPDLCWQAFVAGPLSVQPMPGDHVSFLNRPAVTEAGNCMRRGIDDALSHSVNRQATDRAKQRPTVELES